MFGLFRCHHEDFEEDKRYVLSTVTKNRKCMRNNCLFIAGVKDVKTDLATKIVEVICDEEVENSALQSALLTWSSSSGKSVELLP
jgi:hypothetical protein